MTTPGEAAPAPVTMRAGVVWALASVVLALIVFTFGILGLILWLEPHQAAELGRAMVEQHSIGRWLAMLLIVPTIAVLTAFDKISGEAAIAALSAIAGYVLGSAGIEKVIGGP